jgi:hypothetical protein
MQQQQLKDNKLQKSQEEYKGQFSDLLNQLTKKIQEEYSKVIKDYIKAAETECRDCYKKVDGKECCQEQYVVIQKTFTKYIVNDSINIHEKYKPFLQDMNVKIANLEDKQRLYINIIKQLQEQKIAENIQKEDIKKLMSLLYDNLSEYAAKALMLPSPFNKEPQSKDQRVMRIRRQVKKVLEDINKEVIALDSIVEVNKYKESCISVNNKLTSDIKGAMILYGLYSDKQEKAVEIVNALETQKKES